MKALLQDKENYKAIHALETTAESWKKKKKWAIFTGSIIFLKVFQEK